jgi:diaminopimelate decarboxylase
MSAAEALREALEWIDKYEDAMGHSYCDLNVGGGWASDECTCGFAAKMDSWRAALDESVA